MGRGRLSEHGQKKTRAPPLMASARTRQRIVVPLPALRCTALTHPLTHHVHLRAAAVVAAVLLLPPLVLPLVLPQNLVHVLVAVPGQLLLHLRGPARARASVVVSCRAVGMVVWLLSRARPPLKGVHTVHATAIPQSPAGEPTTPASQPASKRASKQVRALSVQKS